MDRLAGIAILREERPKWPASANVFLLRDPDGAILIDVGCGTEAHYASLVAFLGGEGFRASDVHTVLLSHAHPDHMGAMRFLLEEASPSVYLHEVEVPLAADPELLNGTFDLELVPRYLDVPGGACEGASANKVSILDYFSDICPMASAQATDAMRGGDVIPVGGWSFRVVDTPGHAPGHVSFYEPQRGVLLSGDAVGSIVAWYSPSSGGAAGYLEGLQRMEDLDPALILPSHGGVIEDPLSAISRTRERILQMEAKVLAQLESLGEGASVADLCAAIYPNPGAQLFPGVQIVVSHLIRLTVGTEGDVNLIG